MSVLVGDCRAVMPAYAPFDMILADPPYGDTSLIWDRRVEGRPAPARDALLPSGSLRVFGSLHSFSRRVGCSGVRSSKKTFSVKRFGSSLLMASTRSNAKYRSFSFGGRICPATIAPFRRPNRRI